MAAIKVTALGRPNLLVCKIMIIASILDIKNYIQKLLQKHDLIIEI